MDITRLLRFDRRRLLFRNRSLKTSIKQMMQALNGRMGMTRTATQQGKVGLKGAAGALSGTESID
ncbi:hypothetical protein RvY_01648 [Ramazzottius varieornatus]|uniref:Uncharacterized protein n=1 Tax=Ramazzottius varieornatus TaxID=947166 RepID=A0A1D1UN28_RAMVA|nr:hypothetical protein RvY_01648 [Ramazzottius varieornatus]